MEELGKYKRFRIGKYSLEDESEIKEIRMYLFTTDQDTLSPSDPKNPEARWISRFEVAHLLTHDRDKDFFKKVMSKLPSAITNWFPLIAALA